jgi:hypothetical protein
VALVEHPAVEGEPRRRRTPTNQASLL